MSMARRFALPRFYPILDAGLLLRSGLSIESFARELREAGIRFLQYRDKEGSDELLLQRAAILRRILPASDSCLILNDRVPLVLSAGYDGVHVGQEDLSPVEARALLGPEAMVGHFYPRRESVTPRQKARWTMLPSAPSLRLPPSRCRTRWLGSTESGRRAP